MDKIIVDKIFQELERNNPNPRTELEYTNPFTLLIAIILSAQSTDKRVNAVTENMFSTIESPQDIIKLGQERLENLIKSIGLYKNKAKHIYKLAEVLLSKFNGSIPQNLETLRTLPGVGRKSANVWLNTIFEAPLIAVDTHVLRVANRLGFTSAKTPEKVEEDLNNIVPQQYLRNTSNWLVLHGRYVCKAIKPLCLSCPINCFCKHYLTLSK